MAATTPITSLLAGTVFASGDVLVFVDISDHTQSPQGSTLKTTLTSFFAGVPVPVNVTSASATAFAVGRLGATTPAFTVDASTASQVAGLKITGAATAGTVAVVVTDSGADANLIINAKGTGTIGIGSVSTGRVTITPVLTVTGAATFSSTINSQTISATANFTGTAAFAGVVTVPATVGLAFGGTTSAFVALSRSATTLLVRLADNSGYANISALGANFDANVTISTGGLTVSAGTTAVQALTAAGQIAASLTGATPAILIGSGSAAAFMRLQVGAGNGGAIEYTEGATALWQVGKDYNGGTRAFTIRDVVGAKDAISIASNSSAVTFIAGISATTGAFSGDVTLTGAGSDVIVAATAKFRPDGSASGDTYITETSANLLDLVAGGSSLLSVSGIGGFVGINSVYLKLTAPGAAAHVNFANSQTPLSPGDGDFWWDGSNLKFRQSGVTKTLTWS